MSHHKDPIVTNQYNEKSQGSHGFSAIDAFPSAPAHLQKVGLMFPFGKLQRTILSTINKCVEQWHFILTWVWIKYIYIYISFLHIYIYIYTFYMTYICHISLHMIVFVAGIMSLFPMARHCFSELVTTCTSTIGQSFSVHWSCFV